jgi:hypothetical protein
MSLLVQKRVLGQLDKVHYERGLSLRVEQGEAPYQTRIQPQGTDEPLSIRFSGRAGVKSLGQTFEGAAEIVVTRLRLLLLVKSGQNARGLSQKTGEVALVSVDRADLGPPQRINGMLGKIKRVEFAGAADTFVLQVPFVSDFEKFLKVMAPEYAQRLGHERAAEMDKAKRLEEAQALEAARLAEAEQKQIQAERFGDGDQQSAPRRAAPLGLTMGLLDHLKTWRYKVAAPPDQCVSGFADAFSGKGGLVVKAKWSVERTPKGAIAVYQGRKGLVNLATAFSETAQSEEEGAIGSEVQFEIEEQGADYTICAMWLTSRATRLGFTNDGRFFRPYMRAVETQLRRIDPGLQVVKE